MTKLDLRSITSMVGHRCFAGGMELYRAGNVRPQTTTSVDAMWRIQPRYIPIGVKDVEISEELQAGAYYDLQGRKLAKRPAHGVSICNGRKVLN